MCKAYDNDIIFGHGIGSPMATNTVFVLVHVFLVRVGVVVIRFAIC